MPSIKRLSGHLFFCLWAFTASFAVQAKAIDSLQNLLRTGEMEQFAHITHVLNEEMFRLHLPALACAREVAKHRAIAKERGIDDINHLLLIELGWLRAQMTYATAYDWKRTPQLADSTTTVYQVFKDNNFDIGIAESASILTFYHKHKGDFETSLQYALEASDIYEKLGYPKDAAYLYSQIALEHYFGENLQLAHFYMDKAMRIGLEQLPPRIHISTINTLGLIYEKKHQYDSAKFFFEQATALARGYADSVWIGIALGNIGGIYFQEKNYRTAEQYLLEDLRYSEKYEEWQNVVITLNRLGDIYRIQNQWPQASKYYHDAYEIIQLHPTGVYPPKTLYTVYDNLSQTYAALRSPNKAYEYARQALFWNDSLLRRNLNATIDKIQQTHEWEKRREVLEAHEKAQEKIIKAERTENILLIAGCFILAIFFGVALFLNNKQRHLNLLLKKNNGEILEQKNYIEAQKEELEQQQHEIEQQNQAITETNLLLQKSNQTLKEEEAFLKELLQDLMHGSEQIESQNKELTEEIKLRAHELVAKSEELARLNLQLEGFAYVTAHNIRGPIARLKGLMNIFDRTDMRAGNLQIWQMLIDNTEEVDQIIQDLSIMLEVRTHVHESLAVVSLKEVLQKNQQALQAAIRESGAKFHIALEIDQIYAIPSYIDNIFYQLLSNAIKFRDPAKELQIHIGSKNTGLHFVEISIADNGLGLDIERYKDQLFGMYKRFHLHTKGKGMGLHLAKVQAENLHGSIHMESQVKEGATCYVTLPLDAQHHVIH